MSGRPRTTDYSEAELGVLRLVATGLTNRQIGERLWLTEDAVKSHVYHLLRRHKARGRTHLVAMFCLRGLITEEHIKEEK